jgi:SAM-dependent methyltransferase
MGILVRDLTVPLTEAEIAARRSAAGDKLWHYIYRSKKWIERTPTLQSAYTGPDDLRFIRLVDTEGVIYIREITESGVALPRWEDMVMVGGETDLRLFLMIGHHCYETIKPYLPTGRPLRILDFGIGCARTARHFYRDLSDIEVHGCDVDKAPIAYLDRDVPFIAPTAIANDPPLPYPDSYFDVIYSISVFTHLRKSSFVNWMNEIARCLKPGGRAIHTFHGSHALNIVEDRMSSNSIDLDELRKRGSQFSSEGFVWVPQNTTSEDVDRAKYGCTFTDENRLSEIMPRSLRQLGYAKGVISGWQDIGVFEKISL